ncbi:hypothetical protein [Rhizohabitans arisaemae]|uniref:hypothetical protein n=1 Tax=Rhizohabitans arisaemae TaxID=2720610 RepID=UPI0024B0E356|nr:hypothetical protein [Rhizohabitans arisaemae]
MITSEQARALAEEILNGGREVDEAVEVGVYPFAEGFVAWPMENEPEDVTVLPGVAGGGCVVIDRHSGEVLIRPLMAPELVADHYRRERATRDPVSGLR